MSLEGNYPYQLIENYCKLWQTCSMSILILFVKVDCSYFIIFYIVTSLHLFSFHYIFYSLPIADAIVIMKVRERNFEDCSWNMNINSVSV